MDKISTQYIQRNICQKFIDLSNDLYENKVPAQHVLRGASLALAISTRDFRVTENLGPEIVEIIDDVLKVLEKSQKKGVHFACQAAALEILIPTILGIDYANLK